ncbi:NAD-dependent epimerase/dehydratase family protein [Halocatena halophila]|uniref:NAD-dependent epimerase/dehydratase family protein n=1 Tax=Halocatena halophila TaxID=2814576 RepID=UPI002ED4F0E3
MDSVLIIGGTRFIGRHTVSEFRDRGYSVSIFNRGHHENPFAEGSGIDHIEGDRTDDSALARAQTVVNPDVVVDCTAYHPHDVEQATSIFDDADAYVYISSGAAYGEEVVPKREDETPLCACTPAQARDETAATYGNRKAAGDRAVFEAAADGVRAMSVRPPIVFGPHDYTGRFDYWIDRVTQFDELLVPHTKLRQLVYVRDVASAIRTIAESGTAGNAYNVGTHTIPTLSEWLELIATACETSVTPVFVDHHRLAAVGLDPDVFPLYRDRPHVLSTDKLEALGWKPTPPEDAVTATVAHVTATGTESEVGPDHSETQPVLESIVQ